jgi:pheromone shutdown protein TraB
MLYGMLESKGFRPGQEFRVALDEAEKRGIEVVLGDRVLSVRQI